VSRGRGRLLALLVAAALVPTALACRGDGGSAAPITAPAVEPAPSPTSTTTPAHGGTLALGLDGPVLQAGDLDPTAGRWTTTELQLARLVYDRLAVYDAGHELQPQLAESIVPSDDLTTWTITLRPGIRFHDGSALDAEAVRANLDAQRASATFGPLLAPVVAVEVLDPLVVEVRARSPWSTFPHVLAAQPGYVAAPATLGAPVAGPLAAVGSGPFQLAVPVQAAAPAAPTAPPDPADPADLHLERFAGYWLEDGAQADAVEVRFVTGSGARLADLADADLDVALFSEPLAIEEAGELAGAGDLELLLDPFAEPRKLTVVLESSQLPGLDPDARWAIGTATDRQALARVAAGGTEGDPVDPAGDVVRPAIGPVADESVFFNGDPPLPPDPQAALGGASTYAERYGEVLAITLLVPDDPLYLRVAQAWAAQLADAGIGVALEALPLAEVERRAAAGDFQAAMLPLFDEWHPDLWYPALHRSELTPVGVPGPNLARHGRAAIDEALDAARATGDLAVQVDQYRVVQAQVRASGAYLFTIRLPEAVVAGPQVRDLTTWTTASGRPGLATEGGTVALVGAWPDR
jgi:peptide/nickel transport system substrate-binding protein